VARRGRPVGSRAVTWRAPGRERIVARRVELGLSQRQVAKALTRLGLATAARSVGHWEVGTCSPCEARMEALSLVLAVELWQLEGWLWPGLAVPSARRELAEIRDRTGRLEAALDRAHQETVRRRQSSRAGNE
jgi:transcriptional regulator with XRE-family HTH domain